MALLLAANTVCWLTPVVTDWLGCMTGLTVCTRLQATGTIGGRLTELFIGPALHVSDGRFLSKLLVAICLLVVELRSRLLVTMLCLLSKLLPELTSDWLPCSKRHSLIALRWTEMSGCFTRNVLFTLRKWHSQGIRATWAKRVRNRTFIDILFAAIECKNCLNFCTLLI